MYVKYTKWIISYKEVCGRRPPPSTPDYTPAGAFAKDTVSDLFCLMAMWAMFCLVFDHPRSEGWLLHGQVYDIVWACGTTKSPLEAEWRNWWPEQAKVKIKSSRRWSCIVMI